METIVFAQAVETAVNMTDVQETLIVVTSDHSHTLSISGYPTRGNPILGTEDLDDDGLPYTTLGYANGPGYKFPSATGQRYNISNDNFSKYIFLSSSSHFPPNLYEPIRIFKFTIDKLIYNLPARELKIGCLFFFLQRIQIMSKWLRSLKAPSLMAGMMS